MINRIISISKQKYFETIFKIIISFMAVWYLSHNQKINFLKINFSSYILFLSVFSLFNWFFEIKKWQFLIGNIQKIDFFTAFKQSIISFSISLLTPNRIGEYGGKMFFYEKKQRKKILGLSLMGNLSQLFTTVFFGITAVIILLFSNKNNLSSIHIKIYYATATVVSLIIILISLLFYFKTKMNKFLIYNLNIWKTTIYYSTIRYFSFSLQFFLIWHYFNPGTVTINIFSAIFLTYFISSFIPILAFFDWAVKGNIANLVFNYLQLPNENILEIVSIMWIFNFVFPFITGLILILLSKFNNK